MFSERFILKVNTPGLKVTECKHKSKERGAIIFTSENIGFKQEILVQIKMEIFMIIQKSKLQQEDVTIMGHAQRPSFKIHETKNLEN